MNDKFTFIYESVMKSIIAEDYDRYKFEDVALATQIITHDFEFEWQPNVTGKDILTELKSKDYLKGDKVIPGKPELSMYKYISFKYDESKAPEILSSCLSYWENEYHHSQKAFKYYSIFLKWKQGEEKYVIALDVGKTALAIWKAMFTTKRYEKISFGLTEISQPLYDKIVSELNVDKKGKSFLNFLFFRNIKNHKIIGSNDLETFKRTFDGEALGSIPGLSKYWDEYLEFINKYNNLIKSVDHIFDFEDF